MAAPGLKRPAIPLGGASWRAEAGREEEGRVGGPEGGARAGGSESSAPPGARLVAAAHQRTRLGGRLAPGAVRGPRRCSGARGRPGERACVCVFGGGSVGLGRLQSVRLATCHSVQRLHLHWVLRDLRAMVPRMGLSVH